MRTLLLSLVFWGLTLAPVHAYLIFDNLDFSTGEWSLIGVPQHNYRQLPVQKELGTFILTDVDLMRTLQREWDFDMTFEDKCDYHYALKLYRDGKLLRTIDLNLYCGYITYEGLSYRFEPREFDRIRRRAKQISWSRITFGDLNILKDAIRTLNQSNEVYWYEDVQQYTYSGFFMLSINGLPWNTDRDSLLTVVSKKLVERTGSQDFYLQEYFYVIRDQKLFMRYMVNCDSYLASRLDPRFIHVSWRSHLYNRDSISILALGIDERRYRRLMGQR
jgi:hypothetical protein